MEKTIEEMLRNGTSAEELKQNFARELAAAQARINGENVVAKTKAREKLYQAIKEYAIALGIADEATIDAEKDTIIKMLVDMEDEIGKLFKMLDVLKDEPTVNKCDKCSCGNDDDAIAKFLRGIM